MMKYVILSMANDEVSDISMTNNELYDIIYN